MAREVHELAVALRADGAEETTDALEETQETFEETAATADEESARLEGFASRWRGAMTAIVAGLATAAAGLASRVPVIGELMNGLNSIITQLALDIDFFLRPTLQRLNSDLFDVSRQLADTDSDARALRGGLLTVGSAALIAGVGVRFLAGSPLLGLAAGASVAATGLGLLSLELAGISDETPIAATELTGLEGAIIDVGVIAGIMALGPLAVLKGLMEGGLDNAARVAIDAFIEFGKAVLRTGVRVVGIFAEVGAGIVGVFDFAWNVTLNNTKQALNKIARFVENKVNGIINTINQRFGTDLGPISFGRFDVATPGEIFGGAARRFRERQQSIRGAQQRLFTEGVLAPERVRIAETPATAEERGTSERLADEVASLVEALQGGEQSVRVEVDGREIARSSKPFIGEDTRNRGRFGRGR